MTKVGSGGWSRLCARTGPWAAWALCACGGSQTHVAALDDLERVRTSAATFAEASLAPEAYARADQERDFARAAHAAGDDLGATLHAERAVAAYSHARAIARLARASVEMADAEKALRDTTTEEQGLDASRARLDQDAAALEQQVRIARERLLPMPSGPATPEREAARAVTVRSLAVQARLLCGAARLLGSDAPALIEAEGNAASLEERLAKSPRIAPIDDAARARARCLDVLTKARRSSGYDAGSADALLAELSAAGGWDPSRDERGVVVALRDWFHGAALAPSAATKLAELGRVAAAHPLCGIEVVVHDAHTPVAGETADAKRADAAVQALVRGGAAAQRVRVELAGALAPVVDPSDAKARARNERLEVVFVL